jgi:hypothetical protein
MYFQCLQIYCYSWSHANHYTHDAVHANRNADNATGQMKQETRHKQLSTIHHTENYDWVPRALLKTGGEISCSGSGK